MPTCGAGAASARARVPGADRRRRDQPRLRSAHPLPEGQGVDEVYEPGVFYCKDAFAGLGHGGPARRRGGARRRWSRSSATEARQAARAAGGEGRLAAGDGRLGPLVGAHGPPDPGAALLGRRELTPTSRTCTRTSTATCSSSCTGAGAAEGRGVGAARLRGFRAAARAHVARAGLPAPEGPRWATSPATPTATSWSSTTRRTRR